MEEVTIKDVANKAGVSIGTVSRVINGAGDIKEKNRVKVEEAIKALNFRPNQYAQGLKNNKSKIIGLIIPVIRSDWGMNILSKLQQVAAEKGYIVVALDSKANREVERECINFLWEKRVEGIVIITTGENEDLLLSIRDKGTAVVCVDGKPKSILLDAVYSDKWQGTYEAVSYLIRCGHKKIALVTGKQDMQPNVDRFNSYMQACYDHNIPIQNEYIRFGEFTKEYGVEFIKWFVGMPPENRPTAVITGPSVITYGCLSAAKQFGISIPDDLSLISYGEISMEEIITPRLTYCQQLFEDVSRIATEMIIENIENPKRLPSQVVLTPQLIIHDSVKKIL